MRVILVNNYWYLRGGAEKVAFTTKELLEQAGHQVEIFGMTHPENILDRAYFAENSDFENLTGWKKIKAGGRAVYNGEAKRKFKRLLEDFEPDLVHYHNIYHHLSYSLLPVSQALKIPSVMTLHDYKLISPNYNLFSHGKIDESCLAGHYYRCFFKRCLGNFSYSLVGAVEAYFRQLKNYAGLVDKYLSPSNFLREKFLSIGFPVDKITVLPNPLSTTDLALSKNQVWSEGDYVLFAGRLNEEKGIKLLLTAIAKTPQIKYLIAGDGPLAGYLQKIKQEKNLSNLTWLGWLEQSELNKTIAGCRLLVAPSVWLENYPLNILEAKAKGKIVVASRIGGIPELLPEKLLFSPNSTAELVDKLNYWYNAPLVERQTLGQDLQAQAWRDNQPAEYYKKLLAIYQTISHEK